MKILDIAFGAILGVASFASANAQATILVTDTVDATTDFFVGWLDTGLNLNSATTYGFTVLNPSTTWSAGAGDARTSTANGIDPVTSGFGQQTMDGFTANFGALVGDAGGKLFLIGTGPTVLKGLSGELTVGYWDSYYLDNSGSQTLQISTVPEISTWAMMLAGFAGLGFAGYRRNKASALAA